jgi:acyl carrier protein
LTHPHTAIRSILSEVLICDPEMLPREKPLNDLGAESLDVVEIAVSLEAEFSIVISDDDIVKFSTVGDLLDFVDIAQAEAVAAKAVKTK